LAGRQIANLQKHSLVGQVDFYGKADISFDTSGKVLAEAYMQLRAKVSLHYIPTTLTTTNT
jgi:hypothetical protein